MDMRQIRKAVALCDSLFCFIKIALSNRKFSFTVGNATVTYGNFIQAVITFLITALVLFLMVKAFNKLTKKRTAKEEEKEEPASVPEDIRLLTEIRDLLKK